MSHQLEVSKRNNCVQTLFFFLFPSAFASRFSSFVFCFLYWIARLLYVVAVNAHAFLFFFCRAFSFFFFHFVFFFFLLFLLQLLEHNESTALLCFIFSFGHLFISANSFFSLFFFFENFVHSFSFFFFFVLQLEIRVCVCVMSLHLRCTLTYLCVTQCVCAGRTKREKKTLFVCA